MIKRKMRLFSLLGIIAIVACITVSAVPAQASVIPDTGNDGRGVLIRYHNNTVSLPINSNPTVPVANRNIVYYYPNKTVYYDRCNMSFPAYRTHINRTYHINYPAIHPGLNRSIRIFNRTPYDRRKHITYGNWRYRWRGKPAKNFPVHNIDTGEHFTTIQSAIDDLDTQDGHTIVVDTGTYVENVVVTKQLTLRGIDMPTVDANCSGSAITLTADGCVVDGFHVTGAGSQEGDEYTDAGIKVTSDRNTLINNTASNNDYGIVLWWRASDNTLTNNIVNSNRYDGIFVYYSLNNHIVDNVISDNENGIKLKMMCSYTIISNNTITSNKAWGFKLFNPFTINPVASLPIPPSCCSHFLTITNNNVSNNGNGLYLSRSTRNTITDNIVCANEGYGLYLELTSNNKVYFNNFINNSEHVYSCDSTNIWNSTEKINYTYLGDMYTNYLGNYWGDYSGNDTDNDGIGDTPYQINSDGDYYPLIEPSQNYFYGETKDPKLAFSSHYNSTNISVTCNVPPYQLPLNLSSITNIEQINSMFRLTENGEELLRSNGFMMTDYVHKADIIAPYKDMKLRGVPIFVTADTSLHLYHIQFDEILRGIEEREFFDELIDMSNAMLERSMQDYETFKDPELKEAARRNVAYFSVALTLLQTPTEGYDEEKERKKKEIEEWNKEHPWDKKTFERIRKVEFTIPDYVKHEVETEIANIEKHEGFNSSCIFNSDPNRSCEDTCCYCEDYSQYVPRGHYTRSGKLKRYFKAMMWYGRMAFLLKGGNDRECDWIETPLITEEDAKLATIQASLLSLDLPTVDVGNKTAQELWDRIYSVTAFFVGTADDLTPYEYQKAIGAVFGSEFDVTELADDDKILELKAELAKLRSPEIYGGSGVCVIYPPITREKLHECLTKTKGLRFMGQRFIPDSYMFQHLVSPAVGMYAGNGMPFTMCITQLGPARCFPRGLDVMAVLGSERAEAILREEGDTEYEGINTSYDKQLNYLKSQFAGFNITEWNKNLYWSWLYTLKPLLTEFGEGYPTFMQTEAWQEKELQTSLASWTELRHDTILYAKQSYTPPFRTSVPPKPKPVVGYVEPVPEFYARLLSLTQMTEDGLTDLDVLNETEKARLQSLERILERLINISKAELENKELTEDDYEFIRNFGENLDSIVAGVNNKGKETTIVADVHTDCNTGKVLEEGVGYVNLILVAYKVPDGRIIVGAGPVFSYYEFKQPMNDRLTDEKWKEMLQSNPPEEPGWVKGITDCQQEKGSQPQLYMKYQFSAEPTYQNIEINQSRLIYTYCYGEWTEDTIPPQMPWWSWKDLKREEAILSEDETNDLIRLINQTNFMNLESTYGGAGQYQRYYAYTLSVKVGEEEQEVVYQSFPRASPMPEAFKKVKDKLFELVNKKFNQLPL